MSYFDDNEEYLTDLPRELELHERHTLKTVLIPEELALELANSDEYEVDFNEEGQMVLTKKDNTLLQITKTS